LATGRATNPVAGPLTQNLARRPHPSARLPVSHLGGRPWARPRTGRGTPRLARGSRRSPTWPARWSDRSSCIARAGTWPNPAPGIPRLAGIGRWRPIEDGWFDGFFEKFAFPIQEEKPAARV